MKLKKAVFTILLSLIVYLLLGFIEVYVFRPIVDFIYVDMDSYMMTYGVCILFINPIITCFVSKRIMKFEQSE